MNRKNIRKKTIDMLSKAGDSIKDKSKEALKKGITTVSDAADFAKDSSKKAWNQTLDLSKARIKKGKVIFKDDVEMIKKDCSLLNDWTVIKEPFAVTHSAILATAGMGILANETKLAQLSRSIMDSDASIFQQILNFFFNPQEIKQISKWMDTVPGKSFAGGGVTHRIMHGHDVSALIELIQNHNLAGVAEWFNHVALRDFWTPAGVPYLPFGSNTVYEWLCSIGVSKSTAASLLSVNFWNVMGLIMIYHSSMAFYGLIKEKINTKKVKKLWDRAREFEELEDFDAANQCYDQVLSYVSDRPEVTVWIAMNYLKLAKQQNIKRVWKSNLLRAYQLADSARLKLTKDKTILYYGGVQLSLRGLTTTIMASSWGSFAGENNLYAIKGVIASAIEDLLKMANSLKDKWHSRPFSAIANEALALNLLTASPFPLPSAFSPIIVHKRIVDTLKHIALKDSEEAIYAQALLNGFHKKYPLGETASLTV